MRGIGKRAAAALTAASLVLVPAGAAHAEEMTYEEMVEASYNTAPGSNGLTGWPAGPNVYGQSAIVMDMNSGAILYSKAENDQHYPASITKILTALVALENAQLTDQVTFSNASVDFLEYGDASIGMTPGEVLSLNDAMYGMLLASANEVSYAIAESVGTGMGGDYNTFIQKMNDRSAEIGCTGSHWSNANGLNSDDHYTTAHDMAVIASEVYKYEDFRKITQTLSYTIGATNLVAEQRTFQQNHKMLWPDEIYYYEYCTGGKTGYTDQAMTTLVTMADNGSLQLAAVVLYDYGPKAYEDTRAMFDYAFANFQKVPLAEQQKPSEIASYQNADAYVLLPAGIEFSALNASYEITNKEEAEGRVTYTYEGQVVGRTDVKLTEEYVTQETGYQFSNPDLILEQNQKTGKEKDSMPLVIKLLIAAVVAVVVLLLLLYAVLKYRQIQRRKMRRRRNQMRRRQQAQRSRQAGRRPQNDSQRRRRQ